MPSNPDPEKPSDMFAILLTGIVMESIELNGKHPKLGLAFKTLMLLPMSITLGLIIFAKRF